MPDPDSRQLSRWLVGDYHFDANTNRLYGEGRDLVLEPKPSALLAYFCQHPGRNIGRDELLTAVWHGQIVSDNSISRAIVLLRKALQDDDRTRKYIATVPKLGYRFIAQVSGVENTQAPSPASHSPREVPASPWRRILIGLVLAGVALAFFLNQSQTQSTAQLTAQSTTQSTTQASRAIVPLSRMATTQSSGHLASDGQGLLFTASEGAWDAIYLVAQTGAEPIPISAVGGHANFATWADDGQFVVYQFNDGNRCEFHRIERGQFQARVAQTFYRCVPGSYSELSLSPDNATVYFVERATPHSPYAAYAIDLNGQTKRRLSQPVTRGYGNHYVDVHPGSGELLLLSDHAPGKTSVYELNPASDSFVLRRAFEYGLDSAIWSHRAGFMVHPSRHPSYQLLESSLSDGASQVVVSDSRRISSPRRIHVPAQEDYEYSFTSYLFNRDIELSGLPSASVSSAVMDYLPAISNGGDKLAFISKRSGDSQIWIKNLTDGSLTAIEPPDPGRRFYDLVWSDDDRQLLANTNTGILVYSFELSAYLHNIMLPLPAYAVGWQDSETLSFSHFENDQWQAYLWLLENGRAEALDPRWAFLVGNPQQTLYLDQRLAIFRNGQELTALQQCAASLWRYQLRFRLDGQDIYCHAADSADDLLRFDRELNMTRLPGAVNRFEFFSVRDGLMANTIVASTYSDIMRTRSVK